MTRVAGFALLALGLHTTASDARLASAWSDVSGRIPQAALSARSMDVQAADADGDGDLDLFVALEFAPNLMLRNLGEFRFEVAAGAIPPRGEDSEDVVIGDFDRDGDIDLVFVSEDTPLSEYYRNDGSGRFDDSPCALPVGLESNAGVAGDLDGDGDLDLVLASNRLPERVLINHAGCFDDRSAQWNPGGAIDITQDLQLADLDGDGDLDLVAGNEPGGGGRNRLYLNTAGRFVDETALRLPASPRREETRKVAAGDVDGDGDIDLVFGNVDFQNPAAAANRLLLNDGRGVFVDVSATHLPSAHQATLEVVLADLDFDGDADLLLGNFFTGLQALRNDGRGRFEDSTAALLGAVALPRNSIGMLLLEGAGERFIYEAGFNVPDRLLRQAVGPPGLDPRYSGAFYHPAQSGHGVMLNVIEDGVSLAWFTYDRDGRSMFLVAQGPRPAPGQTRIVLDALLGDGMRFGSFDPASLSQRPWGTLGWTVVDCDRAVLDYASTLPAADGQPFGSGRIEMVRLIRLPGLDCRSG